MTSESLKLGKVSEKSIKEALTKTRGDIFLTSSYLGVATRELDRYIKASNELQLFFNTLEKVKVDSNYEKLSNEAFKRELEDKVRSYKQIAIDEIHKIATLESTEELPLNAALYDVKLKAAIKLLGDKEERQVNFEQQAILSELNSQYLTNATRIKSIRAVQIEYEDKEKTINPD